MLVGHNTQHGHSEAQKCGMYKQFSLVASFEPTLCVGIEKGKFVCKAKRLLLVKCYAN